MQERLGTYAGLQPVLLLYGMLVLCSIPDVIHCSEKKDDLLENSVPDLLNAMFLACVPSGQKETVPKDTTRYMVGTYCLEELDVQGTLVVAPDDSSSDQPAELRIRARRIEIGKKGKIIASGSGYEGGDGGNGGNGGDGGLGGCAGPEQFQKGEPGHAGGDGQPGQDGAGKWGGDGGAGGCGEDGDASYSGAPGGKGGDCYKGEEGEAGGNATSKEGEAGGNATSKEGEAGGNATSKEGEAGGNGKPERSWEGCLSDYWCSTCVEATLFDYQATETKVSDVYIIDGMGNSSLLAKATYGSGGGGGGGGAGGGGGGGGEGGSNVYGYAQCGARGGKGGTGADGMPGGDGGGIVVLAADELILDEGAQILANGMEGGAWSTPGNEGEDPDPHCCGNGNDSCLGGSGGEAGIATSGGHGAGGTIIVLCRHCEFKKGCINKELVHAQISALGGGDSYKNGGDVRIFYSVKEKHSQLNISEFENFVAKGGTELLGADSIVQARFLYYTPRMLVTPVRLS